MGQLTDTLINGDLRVTGNIYGNDVANRVSATYSVANESGGRWAKLASAAVPTGTYCNVNGDWIVRVVGETFSLDMPFTLNVRTYASGDAPEAKAFIKINTESSYGYKNGQTGICVVTYGNTPNVTVEVWAHVGYNYATISLMELASGNRDISQQSKWTYTDVSGAGSSKPTTSGTTRVTDATTVLIGCCADNTYGAGNSTTPVYVSNLGVLMAGSQYAGGTAVSVNQTSYSGSSVSIFAPTSVAGQSGARYNYLVISNDAGNATWKLNTNVEVGAATYPSGFARRDMGATWGTHPNGTLITDWADGSGGDIAFWKNSPSNGQLSALVDGYYYQREGLHRCVDTSEVNLNGAAVIEYSSTTDTINFNFT